MDLVKGLILISNSQIKGMRTCLLLYMHNYEVFLETSLVYTPSYTTNIRTVLAVVDDKTV